MQPEALAARVVRRAGGAYLPRIIERKPRPGDVHPLPSNVLPRFLSWLPLAYLHKLRQIELRPRVSARVGRPFALYDPGERMVILYSLPLRWAWPGVKPNNGLLSGMRAAGATVHVEPSAVMIEWQSIKQLAVWFWGEVVAHELSHHFRQAFRARRSKGSKETEEILACVYGDRLWRAIRQRLRERRKRAGGPTRG
jgi:hypothetical protein